MSPLLASFKPDGEVLCNESYTSRGLVLFDSIFDRIFSFTLLSFEQYHMVDPSTVQCPLSVFWCQFANQRSCSKSISISSKLSPKFAWWNSLHSQLILKSTIICSKFVLVEMFIVVLDNTNINICIWLNTSP